jgi:hypothetical protein
MMSERMDNYVERDVFHGFRNKILERLCKLEDWVENIDFLLSDPVCTCPKKPPKKTSKIAIQNCPKHGRVTWEPIKGYWKKHPDPVAKRSCDDCDNPATGGHGRPGKTPRYYCDKHSLLKHPDPAPECPLCGKSRTLYEHCPCETPPLKARVAQALNFHVMISNEKWCIDDIEKQIVYPIPPYDKDRDLAIGALEEYCRGKWQWFDIHSSSNRDSSKS